MTINPQRAQAVFLAALKFSEPAARRELLDRECDGDAALRQRVEALLGAHDATKGFGVEPSGPGYDPTLIKPVSEHKGFVIAGRYKLLEAIGEGGMGTVWVAEQSQPVKRKVAVKLIKAGMDSKSVLARFEAERQALAVMDHPNIAKVLDGGMTESGRPYFVMEYVKGVPITEYCDAARMSVPERLNLFVQVCQAVQHAHQKGIIHRDLKPSNILVAPYDDKPVPKVIDFGLAKAMHQSLTENTLHTAHDMVLGTPLYMSPEQAQLNNIDVDTRSDIYSLGVLLYELLTGTTPLQKQRFNQAAWEEIRRLIREEEPPRPSTRLSSAEMLASVAAGRQIEPARLTKLVSGELDWIVMKSLEKDRTRRYETANGFALDIQRHLSGEPVLAAPPSARYLLVKFARKHQAGLTTAAGIALLLIASVAVSVWQAVRATKAETAARAAERVAVQALQAEAERAEGEKKERQRAEASEQLATERQAIVNQHIASAKAKSNLAKCMDLINNDKIPESIPLLREAIEFDPTSSPAHFMLGQMLSTLGQLDEAIACFRKALELDPTQGRYHAYLGEALLDSGQFDEALACLRKACEVTPPEAPEIVRFASKLELVEELIAAGSNIPACLKGSYTPASDVEWEKMQRWCIAKKIWFTGAQLSAVAFAKNPKLADYPGTGNRYNAACFAALAAAGEGEDGVELDDKEKTRLRKQAFDWLRGDLVFWTQLLDSPTGQIHLTAAETLQHWQQDSDLQGIRDEAFLAKLPANQQKAFAQLWSEVAAVQRKAELVTPTAPSGDLMSQAKAELAVARLTLPPDSLLLAEQLEAAGLLMLGVQAFTEAEPILRECLTILEGNAPDAWQTFNAQSMLGDAIMGQQKYTEAEPLLLKGYEGLKSRSGVNHPRSRQAIDRLIELYTATDKPDEVTKWRAER